MIDEPSGASLDDEDVVGAQIGRPSRAAGDVVARCHLGLPVVVRMPPRLDDGTPFPTRYWLTCPLAVLRIDRLEGIGGVRQMQRRLEDDPGLAAEMETVHRRYAAERDSAIVAGAGPAPTGGVGGIVGGGVKCLHAHYAWFLAGGYDPVGRWVAAQLAAADEDPT